MNRSCRSSSRSLFASPVPPTCPLHLSWPSRKDEYQKRDEWFTSIPGPACGIASLYIYFPRCCRTHRLLLDDDWIYNRARERAWLLLATTRLLMHSNDRFANKSPLSLFLSIPSFPLSFLICCPATAAAAAAECVATGAGRLIINMAMDYVDRVVAAGPCRLGNRFLDRGL